MVEAHRLFAIGPRKTIRMTPRDDNIVLSVHLQALHPDAHLLEWLLVIELDADVLTLLIDLSCQERRILALIVEVEYKYTIYSCSDESTIFVTKVCKVDEPD